MEKTLIKLFVIASLFVAFVSSLSAQTLSPYWEGRIKLANDAFLAMIEVEPQIAISTLTAFAILEDQNGEMDDLEKLYFKEEILAAAGIGAKYDQVSSFTQYSRNQELRLIFEDYVEKLNALDETKTKADREWERLEKEKKRKGSVARVIASVKKEFTQWATKGEYEKTAVYDQRLNTYGIEIFDSLCRSKIIEEWSKSDYATIKRGNYDADRESYTYTLTYGDSTTGIFHSKSELFIPLNTASQSSSYDYLNDNQNFIEMQVYNGFILPKEYVKYRGEILDKSTLSFEVHGAKPLKICFSDIKYDYSNISTELHDHCFSYEAYRKELAEKKAQLEARADSIYNLQIQIKNTLASIDSLTEYIQSDGFTYRLVSGDYFYYRSYNPFSFPSRELNRNEIEICNRTQDETKELYLDNPQLYENRIDEIVSIVGSAGYNLRREIFEQYVLTAYTDNRHPRIEKIIIKDNGITFKVKRDDYIRISKTITSTYSKKPLTLPSGQELIRGNMYVSSDNMTAFLLNDNDLILIVFEDNGAEYYTYQAFKGTEEQLHELNQHGFFNLPTSDAQQSENSSPKPEKKQSKNPYRIHYFRDLLGLGALYLAYYLWQEYLNNGNGL